MPLLELPIADLSAETTTGSGAFDVLMRAVRAQLDLEFKAGRLKGPEYSTVYLGSLNLAMQTGLQFLLEKRKNALEAQLLEKQLELAGVQLLTAQSELAISQANQAKIPAEIDQLKAQTALIEQQKSNLVAEAANIPKQGVLLDAQKAHSDAEIINLSKQGLQLDAQTALVTQQKANLVAEAANIPRQGAMLDAQRNLTMQQTANALVENDVLVAQECKLRAEFDHTQAETLKTKEEQGLLAQKSATERAQVTSLGVDADSVIGRQKALYGAQTDGFKRDAEQKAAKLLADTWSVRRTTDEATVADGTNLLNDATIGRAISKLLTGVGA